MIAGIDTHKDTLAVAVVDQNGRALAFKELPNTEPGSSSWSNCWELHHVVRVGIEGSETSVAPSQCT